RAPSDLRAVRDSAPFGLERLTSFAPLPEYRLAELIDACSWSVEQEPVGWVVSERAVERSAAREGQRFRDVDVGIRTSTRPCPFLEARRSPHRTSLEAIVLAFTVLE